MHGSHTTARLVCDPRVQQSVAKAVPEPLRRGNMTQLLAWTTKHLPPQPQPAEHTDDDVIVVDDEPSSVVVGNVRCSDDSSLQPTSLEEYVTSFQRDVLARLAVLDRLDTDTGASVAMAASDAAVLTTALCRTMRLRARLVCSLDPTPLRPAGHVSFQPTYHSPVQVEDQPHHTQHSTRV